MTSPWIESTVAACDASRSAASLRRSSSAAASSAARMRSSSWRSSRMSSSRRSLLSNIMFCTALPRRSFCSSSTAFSTSSSSSSSSSTVGVGGRTTRTWRLRHAGSSTFSGLPPVLARSPVRSNVSTRSKSRAMVRSRRAAVLRAALGCGRRTSVCVMRVGSVASRFCSPPSVARSVALTSMLCRACLSGCWPLRVMGAYTCDPKSAYSMMMSRLDLPSVSACRALASLRRAVMRRRWICATARSFSSIFLRRTSSTRWSCTNSFSRSRASMAVCSNSRRSAWMRSISFSRSAHSSSSCSSIIRRRSSKLASSVIGGKDCSNARFCRMRSIISTSANPAGRPRAVEHVTHTQR